MGSKGSTAPPPVAAPVDNSNDALMLMQIMSSMGGASSTMPALPQITPSPDVSTVDDVDWALKVKELTSKATTAYGDEAAKRKGRSGTIRTPSLLDEETPTTTGDLL